MRSSVLALITAAAHVSAQKMCTFNAQTWWYPNIREIEFFPSTGSGVTYKSDSCYKTVLTGEPLEITCDSSSIFDRTVDLSITAFVEAYRDETLDTVGASTDTRHCAVG